MGSEQGELTFYVKAGRDEKRLGACPLSHRVLMVAELKAAEGAVGKFRVVPINVARPLEEFRKLGLRRVPALSHRDETADSADDIVAYLDDHFPGGNLSYDHPEAENVARDFFSRFCFHLRSVARDAGHLESELRRISDFLINQDHVFLTGDRLSHLDCEVLPKLHQVRVAAARLKSYHIPSSFQGLWRYLHAAYSESVFTKTCPSDQEILLHWLDKPDTPRLPPDQVAHMIREDPRFSFDIPAVAVPVHID